MNHTQSGENDIVEMGAVALAQSIKTKQVSCVEVMDAYIDQIEKFNPVVNAIVQLRDGDALRSQAKECDAIIARGGETGALFGIPQAPKDMMPVAGMVTTKGSPIFKDQISTSDAVAYERMRHAGAFFVGRTNTPEFGLGGHTYNSVYGATRNAFVPTQSAGGSSGGAGVAIALRMLPVAEGSDMMGSLRTPAAYNNVFGLRTSMGAVPHGPTDELYLQQFSVTGPMARDIPDLALMLAVQAGYDERLPLSYGAPVDPASAVATLSQGHREIKVGWLGDFGGHLPVEPELLEKCEQSLRHFEAFGAKVEAVDLKFDLELLFEAWVTLRSFFFGNTNMALYDDLQKRALLKPEAVWEIENSLKQSGAEVFQAAKVRSDWYRRACALLREYDVLVAPATQLAPFQLELDWPHTIAGVEMSTYHRWMEVVIPATMAGLPALSAPAGFTTGGLPVGIQIIGKPRADWDLLQIGHRYDLASGFSKVRSPLLK